jgi:ribosome-associated translation inhibitor RaiA
MEIHWSGMGSFGPDEKSAVESRLRRLEEGHNDLMDLRIMGHESRHHRHGDREVRITCQARGEELVVGRNAAELEIAVNEALDAFERSVRRMREKRRDRRRSAPE